MEIFEGRFDSLGEVKAYIRKNFFENDQRNPYQSTRWLTRQSEFLIRAQKSEYVRASKLLELQPQDTKDITRIIDFGGGSGWLFKKISQIQGWQNLDKYYVIENKEIVDYFKTQHDDKRIEFIDSSKELNIGKVDLLYFNSVIQYLENYPVISEVLKSTRPGHIIIEEIPLTEATEYYTAQKYYDSALTMHVQNIDNFKNYIESFKYIIRSMERNKPQLSQSLAWKIVESKNFSSEGPQLYTITFRTLN